MKERSIDVGRIRVIQVVFDAFVEESLILGDDGGDALASRAILDVGVREESGAGQRRDGGKIETDHQTGIRSRPEVGDFGDFEARRALVVV